MFLHLFSDLPTCRFVLSLLSECGMRREGAKVWKWGLAGGSERAAAAGVARALRAEGPAHAASLGPRSPAAGSPCVPQEGP